MEIVNKFDGHKAIEVLLYIVSRRKDMYSALKILFYADKMHLEKYGRLISGDNYAALEWGPVPSKTYDIIKTARGETKFHLDREFKEKIREAIGYMKIGNNHFIERKREPNLMLLSESDIECLDMANAKYGKLSFGEFVSISHEEGSYQRACVNGPIPLESIIEDLPNSIEILDYLQLG